MLRVADEVCCSYFSEHLKTDTKSYLVNASFTLTLHYGDGPLSLIQTVISCKIHNILCECYFLQIRIQLQAGCKYILNLYLATACTATTTTFGNWKILSCGT